jgi:hypothetical protein
VFSTCSTHMTRYNAYQDCWKNVEQKIAVPRQHQIVVTVHRKFRKGYTRPPFRQSRTSSTGISSCNSRTILPVLSEISLDTSDATATVSIPAALAFTGTGGLEFN